MSGTQFQSELSSAIVTIRKASAELASVEPGQLVGADYAKAHQLTNLVEVLVMPALGEFRAFTELPEDRLLFPLTPGDGVLLTLRAGHESHLRAMAITPLT